jgi:hypothetical protein
LRPDWATWRRETLSQKRKRKKVFTVQQALCYIPKKQGTKEDTLWACDLWRKLAIVHLVTILWGEGEKEGKREA